LERRSAKLAGKPFVVKRSEREKGGNMARIRDFLPRASVKIAGFPEKAGSEEEGRRLKRGF